MPTVRLYGPRKVGTAPLVGARLTAAETEASAGVDLARAKGEVGLQTAEALGQIGRVTQGIGMELAREQIDAREEADQVIDTANQNELDTWSGHRLSDPQTGALFTKGPAAFGVSDTVLTDFDKKASVMAGRLTSERQRLMFDQARLGARLRLDVRLAQHEGTERQRYAGDELTAFLANRRADAVLNAEQPKRVAVALASAAERIQALARTVGMGPAAVTAALDATSTSMHAGVIKELLARDQPQKATDYFNHVKDQIVTGDTRAQLEVALETAGNAQAGLKTAETLWRTFGPKTDTDPINLDTMETAAREQFADDPKALDATIKFLRERKAGVDAGRQDRREANAGGAFLAASQGAPLATIMRTPGYLALSPGEQAKLNDYVVSRAERLASRAAAEEGRAYSVESRAYTREQRSAAAKEQAGWARYWDASDPKTLDATSENALQAMRADLGDEHINRLLTQKRALGKSEAIVRAAAIDDDLFKTIAERNGLHAYAPPSDEAKAILGQLKNAVETAIDTEQQGAGKASTRDRKQAIMQGLVDQRVMLNVWGTDLERVAATVTNPTDRAAAYVAWDQINPSSLAKYLNVARGLVPGMADADLQRRFSDRIQHAEALRRLGAGDAEIRAAIEGR